MPRHLYISLLLSSILCVSQDAFACAMSVREARRTIAVADSLRVNEGMAYDDSLALAEAYGTMGRWRLVYSDDYARACYYYGRLLRNRGDQVAAMQAFIRGTHAPYVQRVIPLPWFSDYHILGRIYSNMGTMCHLVGDFELSYDMYGLSAKQFYRACDTTLYYYALNSMALELAMQKLHDETLTLLDYIEQGCRNTSLHTKLWETKAILYENIALFDSAIYAAKELYSRGYQAPTGYVVEAQAYWHLEQYDSALYYAKLVMNHPNVSSYERYNMLHILAYNDSTAAHDERIRRTEERSDIDKTILDPLKEQLVQAITLLRQDLDKRPHYISLATLLLALCIIGGLTWLSICHIRRQRERVVIELNSQRRQVEEFVSAKQEESEQLNSQLTTRQNNIIQDIESTCEYLRHCTNWDKELHWKEYVTLCEIVNSHFYLLADKLKSIYHLDEKEVLLSILVLLDMFNNDALAQILHYGKGFRTYKSRLNAKLGNKGNDLRTKLIQIAVSPYPTESQ